METNESLTAGLFPVIIYNNNKKHGFFTWTGWNRRGLILLKWAIKRSKYITFPLNSNKWRPILSGLHAADQESSQRYSLSAKSSIHFVGTLTSALIAEERGTTSLLEQKTKLWKDKGFAQLCPDTPRNICQLRKKKRNTNNPSTLKLNEHKQHRRCGQTPITVMVTDPWMIKEILRCKCNFPGEIKLAYRLILQLDQLQKRPPDSDTVMSVSPRYKKS